MMHGFGLYANVEAAAMCESALAGAERQHRKELQRIEERKAAGWWSRAWMTGQEQQWADNDLNYRRRWISQVLQGLPGGRANVHLSIETVAKLREWAAL